jgi:hypothetical protein
MMALSLVGEDRLPVWLYLLLGWAVIYTLIVFAVVLAIYNTVERPFEVIVVSLLMGMYSTIGAHVKDADRHFSKIRKRLRAKSGPTENSLSPQWKARLHRLKAVIRLTDLGRYLGVGAIVFWHLAKVILP